MKKGILDYFIVSFLNNERSKIEFVLKSDTEIVESVTAEIKKDAIDQIKESSEITWDHISVSISTSEGEMVLPYMGYTKGDRKGFEDRKQATSN